MIKYFTLAFGLIILVTFQNCGKLGDTGVSNESSSGGQPTHPAYVQSNFLSMATNGTSVAQSFASAENAGNLNVVVVSWNNSTPTVSSVTDSNGNSYVKAVNQSSFTAGSTVITQVIFYAANIAAAAGGNTITAHFSQSATTPEIRILEYGGFNPIVSVEASSLNQGSSTTPQASAIAGDGTGWELVFVAEVSVSQVVSVLAPNFKERVLTSPNGDIVIDLNSQNSSNFTPSVNLNIGDPWIIQGVVFK